MYLIAGTSVKQYQLDKEIRSMAIDGLNNILYGVVYEDYQSKLLKFKL